MFFTKIKKKFIINLIFIFCICYFNNFYVLAKYEDNNKITKLIINNKVFNNIDNNILIVDNNILVSAKDILKPLGVTVKEILNNREIEISYKNNIIILYIDKEIANINNNIVFINGITKILNNKIMVPIESIAENLNLSLKFNYDNYFKKEKEEMPPVIEDNFVNIENNKLKIKDLIIPKKDEKYIFKIEVEGNIDKIEKSIIDNNKLAIDIYNAKINLNNTIYNIENNCIVKKIKFDNIIVKSQEVVRALFDLSKINNYFINISEDKKYIEIIFEENKINQLLINSDNISDYITIDSSQEPFYYAYVEDNLLTIDIYNAVTENINKLINYSKFLSNINIIEDKGIVKITANVDKVTLSHTLYNNKLVIKIDEPTYKNINYIKNSKTIVLNKNINMPIDINNIKIKDDYINKNYIITLPNNFNSTYGYGEYIIYNDIFLKSINIQNIEDKTNIILNENKILETIISEDCNYIYIKIISPKEKYSKIVLLDPGHGGKDTGTKSINNNILEKNIALDISNKVIDLFKNNKDIKAYATRVDDIFVPLQDRASLGNDISDLFISIHLNATPVNFSACGTETYYCKNNNEKDFNIILADLADLFQNNIVSFLKTKNRGVKTASFVVLKNTNIPSILIELGFLTNEEEANKFNTDQFRQKSAEVIYKSILETFTKYIPNRK